VGKKHTYDGKTYDGDKAYRDKNGDVWRFTGDASQMTPGGGIEHDTPLEYLADFRGPLKEL
jgi:hypothetical protein